MLIPYVKTLNFRRYFSRRHTRNPYRRYYSDVIRATRLKSFTDRLASKITKLWGNVA